MHACIHTYIHTYAQVACMGVTDADWTALAYQGLIALDLDVALKSFIRVRDIRYVDLINRYVSMYVCMYVHMCVCVFV